MNKLINWTLGSFFRTLGRFLVYILIGFLLSYLFKDFKFPKLNISQILFMNVHAESINVSDTADGYVLIDGNTFNYNTLYVSANNDINFRIMTATALSEANTYSFMFADMCSPHDIWAYRTAGVGESCTNSCWSNQVLVQKTDYICSAGGYQGNIYRISTPIKKWEKDEADEMAYVSDRISIGTSQSSTVPLTLYGVYFSTDSDLGKFETDYTQTINNINSSIANSGQSIIDSSYNNSQAEINNATQNKNDIINNQNNNTQDIIDNQNSNSQAQIESQKVCQEIDKKDIEIDNKFLKNDGTVGIDNNFGITGYINVYNSDVKILKIFNSTYNVYNACYYNVNKTLISCQNLANLSNLSIPENTYYMRSSIIKSQNRPTFEICKNGNQATADKLDDLQSSITDSSSPDTGELANSAGWLPAGPVDGILNLPLSFLTNLNSNLSKSCQPVNLPLPYINKTLELPCVNSLYAQIEGLPVWINSIGIIASAFMLFAYLINLYKYIDDTLTFRENNYIDNWSGV